MAALLTIDNDDGGIIINWTPGPDDNVKSFLANPR